MHLLTVFPGLIPLRCILVSGMGLALVELVEGSLGADDERGLRTDRAGHAPFRLARAPFPSAQ